jgi:hypothetical protein
MSTGRPNHGYARHGVGKTSHPDNRLNRKGLTAERLVTDRDRHARSASTPAAEGTAQAPGAGPGHIVDINTPMEDEKCCLKTRPP